MKKLSIILLLLCCALASAQNVEKWGCFEASFEATAKGNPFQTDFSATFSNGVESFNVDGFYDGNGIYKLRFMPDAEGVWTYTTKSSLKALDGKKGSFTCTKANNKGPVRVSGTHFAYADGTAYYPVGTTAYSWMHAPGDYPQRTLNSLKESGFNKIRCLFFIQNISAAGSEADAEEARIFPYEKKADGSWDFDRPNPAYYQKVEQKILDLQRIGVECDLILFHPYDKGRWGFDSMPQEANLKYLKYLISRVSAFRNVWWSLANEFDYSKAKSLDDWAELIACVNENDPYGHLCSIHGSTATYYPYWNEGLSHCSIQDQSPVDAQGKAAIVKHIYSKPTIFDEVCYEGNLPRRWGNLSGQEMLYRMYCGILSGCYVTHAECFNLDGGNNEEQSTNYLAYGGDFHGESWKRINFLQNVLKGLPGPLDLADSSWDPRTSTAGEGYYLVYLGKDAPSEWTFSIPQKNFIYTRPSEGEKYKVKVLDTWNMTTKECDTIFETTKSGNYLLHDIQERSVELPSLPYILLIIKRLQ